MQDQRMYNSVNGQLPKVSQWLSGACCMINSSRPGTYTKNKANQQKWRKNPHQSFVTLYSTKDIRQTATKHLGQKQRICCAERIRCTSQRGSLLRLIEYVFPFMCLFCQIMNHTMSVALFWWYSIHSDIAYHVSILSPNEMFHGI